MKTNWCKFFSDLQLVACAVIAMNLFVMFDKGFSWAALCAFIAGLFFLLSVLYMRNLEV